MNQKLIIGTADMSEFELLYSDENFFGRELIQRKTVNVADVLDIIRSAVSSNFEEDIITVDTLKDNIIYLKKTTKKDIVVMNVPEKEIRTFYNGQYYKIKHPNSIIRIRVENEQIREMSIYAYKLFEGMDTKLYKNPMPNGYDGGDVCIGSIDRSCKSYLKDTLRIIEGSYTHSTTRLSGKLANTKNMFEYLQENPFPYDLLKTCKSTMKSILK